MDTDRLDEVIWVRRRGYRRRHHSRRCYRRRRRGWEDNDTNIYDGAVNNNLLFETGLSNAFQLSMTLSMPWCQCHTIHGCQCRGCQCHGCHEVSSMVVNINIVVVSVIHGCQCHMVAYQCRYHLWLSCNAVVVNTMVFSAGCQCHGCQCRELIVMHSI